MLSATFTQASTVLKPQVGVGFSDNVNLESSQKDADLFGWIRILGLHSFAAIDTDWSVAWRDYQTQNDSDFLTGRFGLSTILDETKERTLTGSIALGKTRYVHGNPAGTDTSYNNSYLELGVKPGSIGHSVSSLHRKGDSERRHERREEKAERRAERLERGAEKLEKHAERLEKRAERIEKRNARADKDQSKNQ
jgi:hypothetical protein